MVGKILTSGSGNRNSFALFSNLSESPYAEIDLMRQFNPTFYLRDPQNLPNRHIIIIVIIQMLAKWLERSRNQDQKMGEFLSIILQPLGVSLHWDWLHGELTPSFYLKDSKIGQMIPQMWAKWSERSWHQDRKMGIPLHYSPSSGSLPVL